MIDVVILSSKLTERAGRPIGWRVTGCELFVGWGASCKTIMARGVHVRLPIGEPVAEGPYPSPLHNDSEKVRTTVSIEVWLELTETPFRTMPPVPRAAVAFPNANVLTG